MGTLTKYRAALRKRGAALSSAMGGSKQLVEVTVHGAKGEHQAHRWKLVGTRPTARKPDPKGTLRPGAPPGSQLPPATLAKLKELGISKLPPAHIKDVHVSERLNDPKSVHGGALIKWTDDKGKGQIGLSAEAVRLSHERVFARTEKLRSLLPDLEKRLGAAASGSPQHAAALLIMQTGLRRGSDDNIPGHYGALTMEVRHVRFEGDKAHIEYVGKEGIVNKAEVTDRRAVTALRTQVAGKKANDRVWPDNVNEKSVKATLPTGMKIKDMRTLAASNLAEKLLSEHKPKLTGDAKVDAKAIGAINKAVATAVAAKLNNQPAQAFGSYIAPQIFAKWGEKHGIPAEWTRTLTPKAPKAEEAAP